MAEVNLEIGAEGFNGERTVEVRGASLFVRELGAGPAVVVLHGGPGAGHDYLLPAFSRLADEYRLHFYDQRGGGRSRVERPSRIGWRDHVADLEALRREWALERMAVIGYSWGGLLALLYATEHPDRVRALVLVAPAAGWGDYHRRFKDEFGRRSGSAELERMREELEASGLRRKDPAAYRRRRFELSVAGYFRDPRDALGSTPFFMVQAQAQQATWASLKGYGPELRRKLATLQVPTLILHGRHDPMPLAWAEELAGVLPVARLIVLERSGHVPHVEEAERTFAEIRRFLREELDR
jgi:proline iminopeptidase